MQRLRLKADGRIVELRDGCEFPLAPVLPEAASPKIAPEKAGLAPEVRDLRRRVRLTQMEFADRLGVPHERVFDCIADVGNTSAASVPLALAEALRRGELKPGARIVLGAVGAGLVWGATVLTWGRS